MCLLKSIGTWHALQGREAFPEISAWFIPGCTKVPDLKSESKAFTSLTKYFKISRRKYFSSAVGNSQSIWLQIGSIYSKKLAWKFHPTQVKWGKHISNWKKNFKVCSARKSCNYQYCQLVHHGHGTCAIRRNKWIHAMVKMETETKLRTHRNFISALLYTTSAHCYNIFFFPEVLAQETTTVTGNRLSWDFRVCLYTWFSLDYLKHFIRNLQKCKFIFVSFGTDKTSVSHCTCDKHKYPALLAMGEGVLA